MARRRIVWHFPEQFNWHCTRGRYSKGNRWLLRHVLLMTVWSLLREQGSRATNFADWVMLLIDGWDCWEFFHTDFASLLRNLNPSPGTVRSLILVRRLFNGYLFGKGVVSRNVNDLHSILPVWLPKSAHYCAFDMSGGEDFSLFFPFPDFLDGSICSCNRSISRYFPYIAVVVAILQVAIGELAVSSLKRFSHELLLLRSLKMNTSTGCIHTTINV